MPSQTANIATANVTIRGIVRDFQFVNWTHVPNSTQTSNLSLQNTPDVHELCS